MNHVSKCPERWLNGLRGLVGALALIASLAGSHAAEDTPPTDPAKLQEWIARKQQEGLAAMSKAQAEMARAFSGETKAVEPKKR